MPPAPTRVFISYSHDSTEHINAVLDLANRLRQEGVDCWIDQYVRSPSEGWPRWCDNQVEDSKFVLIVCTETYLRRFRGKEEPDKGLGVTFEGYIITQELYDSQGKNDKFIPIIFDAAQRQHIPTLLKGASNYDVSTSEGYDELYFGILGQPKVTAPGLGQIRNRQSAAAPSAPLPKLESHRNFALRPSNAPPVPSPYFTGREAILEKVRKKLAGSKRVALSGMRGVGKTQIAKQYAQTHSKEYSKIFWARAEKPETLISDFGSIAQVLGLPQKDEKEQSLIVASVKAWLETNPGWLLVLDNADEISLAQDFVPTTHEGHVLLTSTALYFGGWAEKVSVEHMEQDEGALLLLRRVNLIPKDAPLGDASEKDGKLARNLARKLGSLPLALDQAGAYIDETPSTLVEYGQLYDQAGKQLRAQRGDFGKDHPSVTVTFSLAFAELVKRDATAADLVRLCAFLAPDAIPEELFAKGASALGEEFTRRAENPLDFADTVKQAAKFSLIRRDAPHRSLYIHRLVQEVLRDEMDTEERREWAERAVRVVNLTVPAPEFRNWPDHERLLPHAKACAALIQKFSFESEAAATLLHQMAYYMDERAQYGEAEPFHQRSLAIWEKALGPEHPNVATSLNNLALLYNNQGRHAEAEPLHQRSLAIREKTFGSEHPDVAISLNNLALLYDKQERYADAEPLYQRSLTIWEKAQGSEHPVIATILSNLALLYNNQGRHAEAEPLNQRSLAIREKTFGSEHPDVAISLNNLALLYHNQGLYADAEPLYQRALAIWEKALGSEHPKVATTLNNLAQLYDKQGRYAEAEPLNRRSLAIREKTFGPEHPDVAISLNNLALLYDKQERYADAEPLYQRSLAISEKTFGPDHRNVANVLKNYADLLRKTDRETAARPLETRATAIREKMEKK